ncbi:conserved hypothetical protein [Ricinus communis]|uniref:Aminotransferase-like plant mobile domain-containing protein n=1 Tax=Ricinus communis TaxID=3988 RepID=B9RL36_RICCO|nr:conserved hypothetical protein [Ricinus communis]
MEVTEFVTFLGTLSGFKPKNNATALTALLERWSDTTHTFVLHFREMTITPMHFTALTGTRFGGVSVPLDGRPVVSPTLIPQLPGCSPFIKDDRKLRLGSPLPALSLHGPRLWGWH